MLAKLLETWRSYRHPRIADLIDRVSAQIARPPIKAKTVAARVLAWHEIEQKGDPEDVGRLVATPWPGVWTDASPMVRALAERPDDPRIALALARLIDDPPFNPWTANVVWDRALAKLRAVGDVRTLAVLDSEATLQKLARNVRLTFTEVVNHLRSIRVPSLPEDVVRLIEPLEAQFAGDVAREQAASRGEGELLAAIYADPADVGLRQVYADWLSERNDPRGELIALQRAEVPDGEARVRTLLKKHGKAWAGALDDFFHDEGRLFEVGFMAGGRIRDPRNRCWEDKPSANRADLDVMLRDPAWATVRVLDLSGATYAPLAGLLDRLPRVRALVGLEPITLGALLEGPRRSLEEIGTTGEDEALAECANLPALKALSLNGTNPFLAELANAHVLRRLERVSILGTPEPAIVERIFGKVPVLELRQWNRGGWFIDTGFRFVVRGTEAEGSFVAGETWVARSLVHALERLPGGLTALRLAPSRAFSFTTEQRAEIDAALARFTKARIDVPWERAARSTPVTTTGPSLHLRIEGQGLLASGKAWKAVEIVREGLGLTVDSFRTGANDKHRPLGDDPRARVETWAKNARCKELTLYQDGAKHELRLCRDEKSGDTPTMVEWHLGERSLDDAVAVARRLVELARASNATLAVDGEYFAFEPRSFGEQAPTGAWCMVFGPRWAPFLPIEKVARLGLSAEKTDRHVIIRLGRDAVQLTKEQKARFNQGIAGILAASVDEHWGYSLAERARATLGPVAKELLLGEASEDPFEVSFRDGDRVLVACRHDPLEGPRVDVALRVMTKVGSYFGEVLVEDAKATTKAEVTRALEKGATLARERAATFFANPARSRGRKRR